MLRLIAMNLFWEFAPVIAVWFGIWVVSAVVGIWLAGRAGRK